MDFLIGCLIAGVNIFENVSCNKLIKKTFILKTESFKCILVNSL